MSKNIFEEIRDKEAPADIVYENEYVTAFKDIYPGAPVHILIIPNKKIASLNDILEQDSKYLSEILLSAKHIAQEFNIHESGYRLITNCNKDGGQEIDYLHFHLLGGCRMGKPVNLPKQSKKLMKEIKCKKKN